MERKSREKKEIFILTSHTHLGALKAHGYWDEDSDLWLAIPHLEVTLYLWSAPHFFTLSWKRQFSYQSEFWGRRESEEFGGEWEVGFKFWNLANYVKDWWSEGWKMEWFLCCDIGVIICK